MKQIKYYQGTTNGINSCIVATTSKAAAMKIANVSRYYFDMYWGETDKPENFEFEPSKLYIGAGSLITGEKLTWEIKNDG